MAKIYLKSRVVVGLLLWMMLLSVTGLSVNAADNVVHTEVRVKDDEQLLSDEAIESISDSANAVSEEISVQLAVVITSDMRGQSSEAYADAYGDATYPTDDCMILLINMDDREIWISTAGRAVDIYDGSIDAMLDDIYVDLQNEDFEGAAMTFVEDAQYYFDQQVAREALPSSGSNTNTSSSVNGSHSDYYSDTSSTGGFTISVQFWMIFVALILAGGITYWVTVSSRGKRTITARTYETGNSFVLNRSVDDYLRETTTRRHIPKNNTSSGGGHSSGGGGRSHGGGGRKF